MFLCARFLSPKASCSASNNTEEMRVAKLRTSLSVYLVCTCFLNMFLCTFLVRAISDPLSLTMRMQQPVTRSFALDVDDARVELNSTPLRRRLVSLGATCISNGHCTDDNQVCSSSVCKCTAGYYASTATTCAIVPEGYFPSGAPVNRWWSDQEHMDNFNALLSDSSGERLMASNFGYQWSADFVGYIYFSSDSGASWTARSSVGKRKWQALTSDITLTKIVAAVNVGYIYTSIDSGVTWVERTAAGSRSWQALELS
jgi:hypothetical protein